MHVISFSREADAKTKDSMNRMLNIWKERNVFEEELIEKARIGMQRMGKACIFHFVLMTHSIALFFISGQLAKFKAERAKELAAIKAQQENGKQTQGTYLHPG
jgi:regulator of Ty1 transposition protein 103